MTATNLPLRAPKNRRELRELQAALSQMTLAEMLAHYRARLDVAASDRERAHLGRLIAHLEESIAVTLGVKRPKSSKRIRP